jgi:hypothetical protein
MGLPGKGRRVRVVHTEDQPTVAPEPREAPAQEPEPVQPEKVPAGA